MKHSVEPEKQYECGYCDRAFDTERGRDVHEGKAHEDQKEKERKQGEYKCPYCGDYGADNLNSLRIHCQKGHSVSAKRLRIDLLEGGECPTCGCGCGQETTFKSLQKGFADYVRGHHVRDSGGFYTEEGLEKAAETRRRQFREGDREPWNKELTLDENPENEGLQKLRRKMLKENNPERAEKISEALSGREISEDHRQKIAEHWRRYWSKEEHREEQQQRRYEWMKEHNLAESSELEDSFEELLGRLGFSENDYETQKYEEEVTAYYDFYFPDQNTYVEVHGDFWHCNPNTEFAEPETEPQEKNLCRDREKKQYIEESDDRDLLVFWESDVNENEQQVMKRILNELT